MYISNPLAIIVLKLVFCRVIEYAYEIRIDLFSLLALMIQWVERTFSKTQHRIVFNAQFDSA